MQFYVDHQLREQIHHISVDFPITYFHDELIDLPDRQGPVHWHPEFEIVTAKVGTLDYQVGEEHIQLEAGDSIFVNTNMLHRIQQVSGETADPMPGIVFLGTLIAPENSLVYQKYIRRIIDCDQLPYVVFRNGSHEQIHRAIRSIHQLLAESLPLYEIRVQRELIGIFEYLNQHFEELPKAAITKVQMNEQIRVQQMLAFIYAHYQEPITLKDISFAANISRSEAGRCFSVCLNISPVEYLIRHRLHQAHLLLGDSGLTIREISQSCGFHSVSYFARQFRRYYGYTPGAVRKPGK